MDDQNQIPSQMRSAPQAPLPSPVSAPNNTKPKWKLWKIIGIVVASIVVIFGLLVWLGSKADTQLVNNTQSNAQTSATVETQKITLKEFFPLISGNIADYEVTVPKEYAVQYVSINDAELGSSPLANNSLIGLKSDVDDLLAQAKQGGTIDFKTTSRGIFRARFTATTGLDEQGRFVDKTNGPIDASLYENMGMTSVVFKSGLFHNIQGVPMVMITGEFQGSHVRMLYLYSPVDNLVVLFSLQGGQDQADNDAIWEAFVSSL